MPELDEFIHENDAQFWDERSQKYDRLEWANKEDYLRLFLQMGNFDSQDEVLDVGIGTGIVGHSIAPLVKRIAGIDISTEMIHQAKRRAQFKNITYHVADVRRLPFADNSFTRATARMVFHHVIRDTQYGMNECFRVLKTGGKMIFSEGVPPTPHVVPFYTEMFKLKEERITFMDEDLLALMRNAGFRDIQKVVYIARQSSIRNWLENSNLSKEVQERIFQMHLDLDEQGKKDYNMTIKNNDCFIDMKFVILSGAKE